MATEYPFPFNAAIRQRFEFCQVPLWEQLAPDWTPETGTPLHIECLYGLSERLAALADAGVCCEVGPYSVLTGIRQFAAMARHLGLLAQMTIPRDPVVADFVNGNGPAYPFFVPSAVVREINEKLPGYVPSWKRVPPSFTETERVPLPLAAVGLWIIETDKLVHGADKRIEELDPDSELCRTMKAFQELMDARLNTLDELITEADSMLQYDPIMQDRVKEALQGQAGVPPLHDQEMNP